MNLFKLPEIFFIKFLIHLSLSLFLSESLLVSPNKQLSTDFITTHISLQRPSFLYVIIAAVAFYCTGVGSSLCLSIVAPSIYLLLVLTAIADRERVNHFPSSTCFNGNASNDRAIVESPLIDSRKVGEQADKIAAYTDFKRQYSLRFAHTY